jgi:sulfur carrier protein ThiS adenylyltransferase
MKVLAVVGRSGTGKTTLIRSLVAGLRRRGISVAVVKHCGRGFDLGGPDKDSSLFLAAGAAGVVLAGDGREAVLTLARGPRSDADLAARRPGADLVLIEAGRTGPEIPKVEVLRKGVAETLRTPAAELVAVVADFALPAPVPVFKTGRPAGLVDLVIRLAKSPAGGEEEFFSLHDPDVLRALRASVVGIAGAGGLGSNAALALARAGVGTLILVDFDRIEVSNLNRQQYSRAQIGQVKVEALAENLRGLQPYSRYIAHQVRVNRRNVARLFGQADLLIEAFDRAGEKQMLIETWLARFPGRPIIAASGLSGYGGNGRIRERRIGDLYLIGDESSEPLPSVSPMAPRVAVVANMQANLAVELLVKLKARSGPRSK